MKIEIRNLNEELLDASKEVNSLKGKLDFLESENFEKYSKIKEERVRIFLISKI